MYVIIFLSAVCVSYAAKIPAYPMPDYIGKGCNYYDPNLNDCVVRKGAPVIMRVAQGDPKYKIPRLDPLVIDEIRIGRGTRQVGLTLSCHNCSMYGLQYAKFVKAEVDLEGRTCKWYLKLDKLRVTGNYNVTGQVLLLPITGSGIANLNFTDVDFAYYYTWDLEKRANGLTYVRIKKGDLTFNIGKMSIHLENLFNGDRLLGDNMNLFLNENWSEILKEVAPPLSDALADVFKRTLAAMADLVPLENMFPKK